MRPAATASAAGVADATDCRGRSADPHARSQAAMSESPDKRPSLLAAALALPGIAATLATGPARAEEPPEHGAIDVAYLYYRDYQPGGSRMRISAPSFHVLMPLEN